MSRLSIVVAFGAFVALGGCGGGTGGGAGTGGGPVALTGLSGHVVSRNGSASRLNGIRVDLVETGASQTTNASGAFSFPMPPGAIAHLKFTDPMSPAHLTVLRGKEEGDGENETETEDTGDDDGCGGKGGDDGTEVGDDGDNGDTTEDTEDIEGDEVALGGIDASEGVDLEVELDDGLVSALRVTHAKNDGQKEQDGEGDLVPVGSGEGEIEFHLSDSGCGLELEAKGLDPMSGFVIVLTDPGGAPLVLGDFSTNACGEGHVEASTCDLGVDVQGWALTVQALDGTVVLAGTVPFGGTEKGGGGENGGKKD